MPERLERSRLADSVGSAAKVVGFLVLPAEPHRDPIPCLVIGLIMAVFEVIKFLGGYLVTFFIFLVFSVGLKNSAISIVLI